MSDKRLKVLIVPYAYPNEYDKVGGTFVEEQAKAIALYNDVLVFHPHYYPLGPFIKRLFLKKDNCYDDVTDRNPKVIRLRIPCVKTTIKYLDYFIGFFLMAVYLTGSFIFLMHIRKMFKPDMVHCHFCYPAGLLGALISKRFKIPLIISEHAGPFSNLMPTVIHRKLVKYSIDSAAIILPVGTALKKQIDSFFKVRRFKIFPNSVDTNIFYCRELEAKKPKIVNILFVGLFFEVKGIPVLLEAVNLLHKEGMSSFRLDIVGNKNDYLMSHYKKMAEVLDINELVVFHGEKTKKEVAEFMRNCSFLVLSSYAETFGCVVIEALSSGKPVLATKCGGPEELINNENGVLVPPGDTVALKEGLKFMLENYYKFDPKTISENAKKLYSNEIAGKRLSEIYLSLVGREI